MNLLPFRRFRRSLAVVVRRRPRLVLGLLIATAVATAAGGGYLAMNGFGPSSPTTGGAPAFTYAGSWTLLELQRHIEAGEVAAVTTDPAAEGAESSSLVAKTKDGQVIEVSLAVEPGDAASSLVSLGYGELLTSEAWASVRAVKPSTAGDPFRSILGIVLPLSFLLVFVFVLLRFMNRGRSGRRDASAQFMTIMPTARTPAASGDGSLVLGDASPGPGSVRLADVAGCDEAKLELTEAIEFLKSPERFHKLGARIPRGILLYGPPGTGKTMLARAVAAEADVPFHYASGSEFVEKFVGVGARRVRDLFAQARKLGRGVIFFDEFDALGKVRGGNSSHEEREQTLNQLLVELDGFTTNDDLIVIAATNRIDVLDPAVLRPGRFNRKIHVGLPDVAGRHEILGVHSRNKPIGLTTDLGAVARKTYGFSGAQLADLLNEAAIMTARRGGDSISPEDLHGGWLKVAVGTGRRRSMDERERSIIAAHEVGHAICGRVHGDKRKVEEISLFAHGEALGVTVSSQEDNDLPAESDLRARLVALMGGRAAEELLFHEVTGGASNDFEKANQIATMMVTRWAMGRDPESKESGLSGRGKLSFLVARPGGNLPSEVQAAGTRAIGAILDEAYREAGETLLAHMETLRRISAYLVEHERVDGETFDELFEGRLAVPNAQSEWRPTAARPREWGEIAAFHGSRLRPIPNALSPERGVELAAIVPAGSSVSAEFDTGPSVQAAAAVVPVASVRRTVTARSRRTRRPQVGRRLRGLAAGYLHVAAGWLLRSEPEPDEQ